MPRPTVDVVVPFLGTEEERGRVIETMSRIALRAGDTLTIVDNGPRAPGSAAADPLVIHAARWPTSYHARNVGAARGSAEWIHFLDADVVPREDLLDRCFGEPAPERVAVLAGAVVDEAGGAGLAGRHAAARAPMDQAITLDRPRWSYAQTANAAFRRTAFERAGGFAERLRSGGDADLCFRLRDAGWQLAYRPTAVVTHRSRPTLAALARQRARHGAGAAWLDRRHPGSMPARSPLGATRAGLAGSFAHARRRAWDDARLALVDVLLEWSFVLGRLMPNERRPRR